VNIRLIEGRSQQRKDEISKRVTDAISEVLQLPKDDVWVVFEDIRADFSLGVSRTSPNFAVAGVREVTRQRRSVIGAIEP
jgi:4-oxalocrotonate tautomerase